MLKQHIFTYMDLEVSGTDVQQCCFLSDVTEYDMAYYNLTTRLGLTGELEDTGRRPLVNTRISFRGLGCNCESLTCDCCAGINLTSINFSRRACTNFTYDPHEFAIKLAIMMNENVVYTNSFSGE